MKNAKWIIGEPGGPAGPFYSVVSSSGLVIAMQVPDKNTCKILVRARDAALGDFATVQNTSRKLGEILSRDFPENSPDELPVEEGAYDYVIRSVAEALFSEFFEAGK